MSAEDMEFGTRFQKVANLLQGSRTVRFLSRERDLTFTDLIEEWLAWRPAGRLYEADNETLKAFVAHVCSRRDIKAEFYERFGALEFA
jgi:hypothetical protein